MLNKDPWLGYVKPGRIFGNLYFIGTHPTSVHLIDTGDGLMLIDTGCLDNLYLVIQNMWELGFNPKDIKKILISHGHYDHMNATAALVNMTGAETFLGEDDLWLVTGEVNHCTLPLRPFKPDVLLKDGDVVTLGNTSVRCVSTPGHTDGVMSFFFDVTDGEKTLRAGMHGGVGLNTLNREFLTKWNLPFENRQKYFDSLKKLESEHVDVFIGNHVGNNDTEGKLKRAETEKENPFVDPDEWQRFLVKCRVKLEELIESEKNEETEEK
jgi:metallo-beta-lactamase class B